LRLLPVIAVTNESSVLHDDEVRTAMVALQQQIHYDFRPYWDLAGQLVFCKPGSVPPEAWHLVFLDDSDQAGALGYHDLTETEKPILKVFAKTDKQYGLSWTVTASHEILEALADPWICAAMQTSNTEFYALEVGDPVEADKYAYDKHGTLVSDFILPSWFVPGISMPKYDFAGHLKKPLEVIDGGYCSIYVSGQGWTQKQMRDGKLVGVALEEGNPRFRDRSKEE
jgi:hypothetical protein